MKKFTLLFLTLSLGFITTSCDKDNENQINATVNIKVVENGAPKSGVTVCMFPDNMGPETDFFKPLHAKKKVISQNNGIATFELKEIFDLEIINNQTTLYFAVFNNNNQILGQTATTIKKDETKSETINY